MIAKWKYRIYARCRADLCYFEVELEMEHNQDSQLDKVREEFGAAWDVWVEKFPFEHPHAALQRRLNYAEMRLKLGTRIGNAKKVRAVAFKEFDAKIEEESLAETEAEQ